VTLTRRLFEAATAGVLNTFSISHFSFFIRGFKLEVQPKSNPVSAEWQASAAPQALRPQTLNELHF
jgi:hypothetical protein